MKKLLILLLLSLGFIGSAYANEVADSLGEVNVQLESGYHENGVISYKGNVKDGKKDGKWTYWNKKGQKDEEKNYKDGDLVSVTDYTYHENGAISYKGKLKDGKKDGTWTWWYANGQKSYEENYKDGKIDGKETEWYENGQIKAEVNYKDNKLDGKSTWWNKNGQIRTEANYKDGKLDGKQIEWYENGQIMQEVNYKDGKLDGNETEWYENGKIRSVIDYKDGDLVSEINYKGEFDYGVDPQRDRQLQLKIMARQQENLKDNNHPTYINLILSKFNLFAQRISVLRLGIRIGYMEGSYAAATGSFVDLEVYFVNIYDFINYFPRALQIGFLSPFPVNWLEGGNQVGRLGVALAGIEMAILYIMFVGCIYILYKAPIGILPISVVFLISIGIIILLGYTLPNIGAIYRMRQPYLIPFYLAGVQGLYLMLKNFNKN